MMRSTVKVAVASDEGEFLQVAFGEATDGSDTYIILQLSKEPTEEDRKLNLTGIYTEINGQEHSAYNAINQIEIKGNVVSVFFDAAALDFAPETSPFQITCADERHPFSQIGDMLVMMGRMTATSVKIADTE